MIQLSPHTELTPHVQEQHVQEHETAALQESRSKQNRLGVFAKILAGLSDRGLLRKTGTGEHAAGVEISGEIPLAEKLETGETETGKKEKGIRAGKTAVTGAVPGAVPAGAKEKETKKSLKTSETGSEIPNLELSDQEKNAIFAVGRLTGQNEELSLEKTDNVPVNRGETEKTEVFFAELTQGKAAQEPEKQTWTASTTVFTAAESDKKTKTRINNDRDGIEKTANEVSFQQNQAKKAVSGEKEGPGKLEEARNRRRGLSIDVQDLRSANGQAETALKESGAQLRTSGEARIPGEGTGKDIVLELRLPNEGRESASAVTNWETKAGQAFEDLLARELHQNFNNDIVRHASIALRDGNEGTIRLALKPESLGSVKIRLEMADNKITGHIVVESKEALRAFEREISSLEKAFRDSGFDGANLEMSLAADGRGAEQQWQGTEASQFLPGHIAASRYDAAIERTEIPLTLDVYQQGTRVVNMFA